MSRGGAGEKEGGGDDVEKNGDLAPASAASATAATTGGLTLAKIELVNRDEKRAAPRDDASDDASDASDASDAPSPSPSAPASPGRGRARRELMTSGEYILLLAWFSVIMPPMQYYIMSIGYQLERKGDDDGLYTSLFALLYGLAAALAPPAGMVADRFGVGVGQGVATSTLAISFLILLSPSLPAQVVGMAFYSVGRLFVFAMYFSNLGRRFGFEHYGALAGDRDAVRVNLVAAAVPDVHRGGGRRDRGGERGERGVRRRRRGGVSVHRVARGEGAEEASIR